jgi:hypothetical protein
MPLEALSIANLWSDFITKRDMHGFYILASVLHNLGGLNFIFLSEFHSYPHWLIVISIFYFLIELLWVKTSSAVLKSDGFEFWLAAVLYLRLMKLKSGAWDRGFESFVFIVEFIM